MTKWHTAPAGFDDPGQVESAMFVMAGRGMFAAGILSSALTRASRASVIWVLAAVLVLFNAAAVRPS